MNAANEPEPTSACKSQCDGNLLSSLLGDYATETSEPMKSKAEVEMKRYLAEAACDMSACPLQW